MADFAALRVEYQSKPLREDDVGSEPFAFFQRWMEEAVAAKVGEPNAMALATVDAEGRPSVRMVLLKDWQEDGLTFFTSYVGRKARELDAHPSAAAVFFWEPLHRQVRFEGVVAKVSPEASGAYFRSRPRDSRIAAWASQQSDPIASRESLAASFEECEQRFSGVEPPLPPFWGGYVFRPDTIEFWQGQRNRLHDRLEFQKQASGDWTLRRLSP